MEGLKGKKFFAREPSGKPAARASARSRAEKLSFPFRKKIGAHKIKNVKAIFLRGGAARRHGGGAERLDFFRNFR